MVRARAAPSRTAAGRKGARRQESRRRLSCTVVPSAKACARSGETAGTEAITGCLPAAMSSLRRGRGGACGGGSWTWGSVVPAAGRSEEHTSELQSLMCHLVCRLLLEKKKQKTHSTNQ